MAGKMFKQGSSVNRGVDSLFDSLSGRHDSDSDLESMERSFNSLMARAQDLEREIIIKVEQQGKKRKREVEVWFEDVKKVEGEYLAFKEEEGKGLIFGGDEAIKLNARIHDLDNRSRLFGELVQNTTWGLPFPTKKLEGATFQDNFRRICNLLENDQVSSIGVHGMGGVGKSTLVDHIHNHLLRANKCVCWLVVRSQRCSIKMLQDRIAMTLRLNLWDDDDDEGARARRLNHALSQRENFILILDNVWKHIDLLKVGVPLSQGCKLMMTSRSLNVCREMNCQKTIVVKPLSKDEGWNLFLKNLGKNATLALGDSEVEGIAKRMVEICDGLPLGIITLAGAVSEVTEIHEWRHELGVLEESAMGQEFIEEKVFSVLQYSFARLNPNDQSCFLYCSLYPEDYTILRDELSNVLISEKLVDEKKSRAAQHDEGHSIVTRLVKISLLERVYDRGVKMHDVVRDMAHKITNGKTMVIAGQDFRKEIPKEEEWTKDLEKVSLMVNKINEIPHGISPNCPKLSTLLLQYNPLARIATSFFSQMCGLYTLDLSHTKIEELPDSVSDLVNLTSLLLKWCRKLRHVPCVKKLKKLRKLNLVGTSIEYAPQGMEELRIQLLYLPYHVRAELVEGGEMLEVYEGGLKHVSDFNRLFPSKRDGVSYCAQVGDYNVFLKGGDYISYFDLNSVDFGHDPYDTRRLIVSAYDLMAMGRQENELSTILAADYIQRLDFHSCVGMSKCILDDLTNPASLKCLKISSCGGIECLLTYDQYKAPQHQLKSRFHALEVIVLRNLKELTGVIQRLEIEVVLPPSSVFSSLRKLTMSKCNKVKNLGLPNSIIEKLEYISIDDCEEIEEIIRVAAADDDGAIFISLPNLTYLSLIRLPNLKSFCDAPVICNLLNHFLLSACPRLEVPFLSWGTPDSYKPLFPGYNVEQIRRQSL